MKPITLVMRCIVVRSSFHGLHHWPDAPEEVAFLRHPHRHRFGVRVEIRVTHPDRELEFIMVEREVARLVDRFWPLDSDGERQLGSRSCESIAESIGLGLLDLYPRLEGLEVEVDEDGTHSGVVVLEREP